VRRRCVGHHFGSSLRCQQSCSTLSISTILLPATLQIPRSLPFFEQGAKQVDSADSLFSSVKSLRSPQKAVLELPKLTKVSPRTRDSCAAASEQRRSELPLLLALRATQKHRMNISKINLDIMSSFCALRFPCNPRRQPQLLADTARWRSLPTCWRRRGPW